MMGLDNPVHLVFLFVLLLLVFGAKRLPELGRSLGGGLRGFKESISGETPVAQLDAASVPSQENRFVIRPRAGMYGEQSDPGRGPSLAAPPEGNSSCVEPSAP